MTVNPNNYTGITATVVGTAGGEVDYRVFSNGGSQAELSIAVGHGFKDKNSGEWIEKGTTWIKLLATSDHAEHNWPYVGKGDRVRVDEGRLETREFDRKDGTKGQAFELRYGNVTVIDSKQQSSNEEKPF